MRLAREREPEKAIDTKMYQIRDIGGFDLLEYPGVDEDGINDADLEDAIVSRSQLVVFITSYRLVHLHGVNILRTCHCSYSLHCTKCQLLANIINGFIV